MDHWRIVHKEVKIPDYEGSPLEEALHVKKHLDKTKFQKCERQADMLTAIDQSNCRVTIAVEKAAFSIYRPINSAATGRPAFLRPLHSDTGLPGCSHEIVDMNTKIFDLVNDNSKESLQLLDSLSGFEDRLSPAALEAYRTWQENQRTKYSSFRDFIEKKGDIDADCCTDISDLECAFVIDAGSWANSYTEELKRDFKEVFDCPVHEFPDGNFEFQTNGNEALHELISDFINIAAGFCGECTYHKYFGENNTNR